MSALRKLGITIIVLLVIGAAGLVALSTWDPPAPTQQIEKDISDELLQD